MSRIIVRYWPPPIPIRKYDYCAYRDGYEEIGQYGFGETEQEALDELAEIEAEHAEGTDLSVRDGGCPVIVDSPSQAENGSG